MKVLYLKFQKKVYIIFGIKILALKKKIVFIIFYGLNLIDRKNEKEIIQKIIKDWINKFNNYKKDIWKENIISKKNNSMVIKL